MSVCIVKDKRMLRVYCNQNNDNTLFSRKGCSTQIVFVRWK